LRDRERKRERERERERERDKVKSAYVRVHTPMREGRGIETKEA
jgi:hypothetical protein